MRKKEKTINIIAALVGVLLGIKLFIQNKTLKNALVDLMNGQVTDLSRAEAIDIIVADKSGREVTDYEDMGTGYLISFAKAIQLGAEIFSHLDKDYYTNNGRAV